jgi:hypothetical protein
MISVREYGMNDRESFSNSTYEEQAHLAERELSSFVAAVTKLFGPDEAKVAADDWLDESDLMDSPPRSDARDWRSVTIAASARLADRVDAARYRQQSVAA